MLEIASVGSLIFASCPRSDGMLELVSGSVLQGSCKPHVELIHLGLLLQTCKLVLLPCTSFLQIVALFFQGGILIHHSSDICLKRVTRVAQHAELCVAN